MASTMYKGKNLRIKLDGGVIYHATDCNFSSDIEIEKIATKDTNGNLKITGAYDWNLSSSGVVANKPSGGIQEDFQSLLNKHKAGTEVAIEFTTGEIGDFETKRLGIRSSICFHSLKQANWPLV